MKYMCRGVEVAKLSIREIIGAEHKLLETERGQRGRGVEITRGASAEMKARAEARAVNRGSGAGMPWSDWKESGWLRRATILTEIDAGQPATLHADPISNVRRRRCVAMRGDRLRQLPANARHGMVPVTCKKNRDDSAGNRRYHLSGGPVVKILKRAGKTMRAEGFPAK